MEKCTFPISTQDFNLDPVKIEAKFRDYEAGMAYARQTGKPVEMGGANALTALTGAPQRPGTIYTAKAKEQSARKKRGTEV